MKEIELLILIIVVSYEDERIPKIITAIIYRIILILMLRRWQIMATTLR